MPLDKAKNAEGLRRRLPSLDDDGDRVASAVEPPAPGMAPLLRKLMADYAATGLPPAYLADHRGGDECAGDETETDEEEIER